MENPEVTSAYENKEYLESVLVEVPSRVTGVTPEAVTVDEQSTSGF